MLDLQSIRDLLDLCNEKRVQSFQGLGLTFVFKDDDEVIQFTKTQPTAQVSDDGHSTSNKRVDGFKNPALWPHQNGKALKFDGSLE